MGAVVIHVPGLLPGCGWLLAELGGGHALGDDHAPGVEYEFGAVDGVQADLESVETQVLRAWAGRTCRARRRASLRAGPCGRRSRVSARRGERRVDDPSDPELDLVSDENLVASRQVTHDRPQRVRHLAELPRESTACSSSRRSTLAARPQTGATPGASSWTLAASDAAGRSCRRAAALGLAACAGDWIGLDGAQSSQDRPTKGTASRGQLNGIAKLALQRHGHSHR
jgi:hypothetical protein